MTGMLVLSLVLSASFLALSGRSIARGDTSFGLALGVLAVAWLAPQPFAALIASIAVLVGTVHRDEVARAQGDQEAVLAHVRNEASPKGVRIEDVRDPEALAALARFRESQRVIAEASVPERDERRGERHTSNVRSRFMAAMGHELRSPLNSIIGFAQVLEDGADGPLTPAQRENVTLVRVAADELLLLLTDILDSSRLEAGRVKLDRKWTASVEILTLTTQRARPLLEAAEREIEVEIQPGLPPLFVDRSRIAQSLTNLVRQALKAHASTKRPLRLRARSIQVDGTPMVRFDLVDPTRELSDADVEHAFDSDPDLSRTGGRSLALGLALGLARDLARLHDGDARCENADGGGACWYLLLPIARAGQESSAR